MHPTGIVQFSSYPRLNGNTEQAIHFNLELFKDKKKEKQKDDDDNEDVDDDFLDLVARSDIPQPGVSEKQIRSDMENEDQQSSHEQQKRETR